MARIVTDAELMGVPEGGAIVTDAELLGKPPQGSEEFERGRGMGSGTAGLFTALQGPLFGFADELAGVGGALVGGVANLLGRGSGKGLAEDYRAVRDYVRGGVKQYEDDRPVLATAAKLATAAPLAVAAPAFGAARAAPIGIARATGLAARAGAGYGAVQGAGDAETLADIPGEAAGGALRGAVTAGIVTPAIGGASAITGAIGQRISNRMAANAARRKIAEALARDAGGAPAALDDAADALRFLGPEARVADLGAGPGKATRGLLDTMATLPGETQNAVEAAIRARQIGAGGRIAAAADEALGTRGAELRGTVQALVKARQKAATPLYAQLERVSVPVDDELAGLLARGSGYAGKAAKLSRVESGTAVNLRDVQPGDAVPLRALDTLKNSLYDAAQAAKRGGESKLGRAIDGLRVSLVEKLDDLSPKNQAGSIYKQARDAFAGPSQMKDAAEAGAAAMREEIGDLAETVAGLSASELQAFRVGALQALKQKAGTESGRTSLLKFWKESNTGDRLRVIFGDNYGTFANALLGEGKLKALEGVGRGSQTASRLAAFDDVAELPPAVTNPARLSSWIPSGRTLSRFLTPEATRDEMGRLLLAQGPEAELTLNSLRRYIELVNAQRARQAQAVGLLGTRF